MRKSMLGWILVCVIFVGGLVSLKYDNPLPTIAELENSNLYVLVYTDGEHLVYSGVSVHVIRDDVHFYSLNRFTKKVEILPVDVD